MLRANGVLVIYENDIMMNRAVRSLGFKFEILQISRFFFLGDEVTSTFKFLTSYNPNYEKIKSCNLLMQ